MTITIDLIELFLFLLFSLCAVGIVALLIHWRINYKVVRRQWKRVGQEWYEVD